MDDKLRAKKRKYPEPFTLPSVAQRIFRFYGHPSPVTNQQSTILDFDQKWEVLKKGIIKVNNIILVEDSLMHIHIEYVDCYTIVYNMCAAEQPYNYSMKLYLKYLQFMEDDLVDTVLPSVDEKDGEHMLRELVSRWGSLKHIVRVHSTLFRCLDRFTDLPTINEVGLMAFGELVLLNLKDRVLVAVMSMIDREREGEQIDRALLKNVVDIFVETGIGKVYENDFEDALLKCTADYYSLKASSWISEYSCPDYMLKVDAWLKHEEDILSRHLRASSKPKLLEKARHQLLSVYATQLLEMENSGCEALLRFDKREDLSRMYSLFSEIPEGLEPILAIFKQHVTSECTAFVNQLEAAASTKEAADKRYVVGLQEQDFVWKMIELHENCVAIVNNCFNNHKLFRKGFKDAFKIICQKTIVGRSNAELLTSFCDRILKKGGSEKLSDEDIEQTLEKVVNLLEYISDKDLFTEFYRRKFAERLIRRSSNEEFERSMLRRLKRQEFETFKMEKMAIDITLQEGIQTNFEEYLSNNPSATPGIEFNVTVLPSMIWPEYETPHLNLPAEMVKCVDLFQDFYRSKKGGKLGWIHSLGRCCIKGNFDAKSIDLCVTTYQASTLLLFNTVEKLSYKEIRDELKLTDEHAVGLLYSLSCAKYNILIKEPDTKTISDTDTFEFNSKFTNKMQRIKMPLPPVDEKKEEKKVFRNVDQDRTYAIRASIVRIMKSRLILGYHDLFIECMEQLKSIFELDLKVFKKRVEQLIEQDYLERDKENPCIIKYLA